MKKISVRTCVFNLLQFLYYSLCLCGLIWQVVEISNNFFLFGVVSDIKIFMADTIKEDKNLHICFRLPELLNMTVYEQLRKKYHGSLTSDSQEASFYWNLMLDEMFRLSLEPDEVFNRIIGTKTWESYIHGYNICYEFRGIELGLAFKPDSLSVSEIEVLLDDALPKACRRARDMKVYEIALGAETSTLLSVNYYDMIKLPSPYLDNCFDYTSIGYVDQHNAIGICRLEYAMTKGFIPNSGYCYKKSEAKYLPYRMYTLDGDNCNSWYQRVDCRMKYFRMVSDRTVDNSSFSTNFNDTEVFFLTETGNDPSFLIESKPRIDNIDYVTYVCGALGTWFGICALNFNPFPILFKPNEPTGDNTNAVDHFLVTPSRVKKLEERLAILSASFQLQLSATSGQLKELSQDFSRLNTKYELAMSEIE